MTAALQAPVVCILDSGTNEAGAEGWNYLTGNEDLTDEAGHGDLIYQLLESETSNARLIMLKCFESAEETEEKKGTETITQALYDAVDLWQADVASAGHGTKKAKNFTKRSATPGKTAPSLWRQQEI